jgi:opacity protein-like surface antigen
LHQVSFPPLTCRAGAGLIRTRMNPRRSLQRNAGSRLALMSVPLVTGCLLAPGAATAQEALRTVVEGDRSYQIRRQQASEPALPMSWGPVGFSLGAYLRLTYDDNVLLRETDRLDDFIVAPGINFSAFWPITDRTRLSLDLDLSYLIYTQDTRDDRLNLSATTGSGLALDFEVGRTLTTIYDRFSLRDDLLDEGEVSNARNYGIFNNTAGIRSIWAPEPVYLEGGYAWSIDLSTDGEFRDRDRNSHQVFGRIGHVIEERTRWGVEATAAKTFYDIGERNDFTSLSAGPYLEWQMTESINLSLRGGWSWTLFDQTGSLAAPDDLSVPYIGMSARHQLTENFSHSLSATREVRVGFTSQYTEVLRVNYGFGWQITDIIRVNGGAFYEFGEIPRDPVDEEYDRYGFTLGVPFRLTDRLSLSLGYQFTVRDSNVAGRDYTNNRVTATLGYAF